VTTLTCSLCSAPIPLSAFDAGWRDGWDIPPDPTGAREPTDVDDR